LILNFFGARGWGFSPFFPHFFPIFSFYVVPFFYETKCVIKKLSHG
jgi:hypothetical protein